MSWCSGEKYVVGTYFASNLCKANGTAYLWLWADHLLNTYLWEEQCIFFFPNFVSSLMHQQHCSPARRGHITAHMSHHAHSTLIQQETGNQRRNQIVVKWSKSRFRLCPLFAVLWTTDIIFSVVSINIAKNVGLEREVSNF